MKNNDYQANLGLNMLIKVMKNDYQASLGLGMIIKIMKNNYYQASQDST